MFTGRLNPTCPVCGADIQKTNGQCARGCPPVTYSMRVKSIVNGQEWCAGCARLTRELNSAQRQLGQSEKGRIWEQERANAASATIVTLRDKYDQLRSLLRAVVDDHEVCPICGERLVLEGYRVGDHVPDCPLKAALEGRDG